MNRDGHEAVSFFVGTEVEHSPAHGLKTLFVVGLHDPHVVLTVVKNCRESIKHIYFGANQSFPKLDINDGEGWRDWEFMIQSCMDLGFLCTLDLDVAQAEGLLEFLQLRQR